MINSKAWYMSKDRQPPFTTMSRRPGIGAGYLTEAMIAWHRSGRKNHALLHGVKRHLPRYYKEKIFSKIDRVRIAVRDQKAAFNNLVRWIRSPAVRNMRDPLAQRERNMLKMAATIRFKSKEKLTI